MMMSNSYMPLLKSTTQKTLDTGVASIGWIKNGLVSIKEQKNISRRVASRIKVSLCVLIGLTILFIIHLNSMQKKMIRNYERAAPIFNGFERNSSAPFDLKDRLLNEFFRPLHPYTFKPIPHRLIWTGEQKPSYESFFQSWTTKNPSSENYFIDEKETVSFIQEKYKRSASEMVTIWKLLPTQEQKSILQSFLAVNAIGGLWLDQYLRCLVPIESWYPLKKNPQDIGLIAGLETSTILDDSPNKWYTQELPVLTTKIFAGRKGHPALIISINDYIEQIASSTNEIVEYNWNCDLNKTRLDLMQKDTTRRTNADQVFTLAVLDYLRRTVDKDLKLDNIISIHTPTVIGDVLILPLDYFKTRFTFKVPHTQFENAYVMRDPSPKQH